MHPPRVEAGLFTFLSEDARTQKYVLCRASLDAVRGSREARCTGAQENHTVHARGQACQGVVQGRSSRQRSKGVLGEEADGCCEDEATDEGLAIQYLRQSLGSGVHYVH
jgi:hypothetical protein